MSLESVTLLVSGSIGIILLFIGNEMVIQTVEKSRTHDEMVTSSSRLGVSEWIITLFRDTRQRWYILWYGLLVVGGILLMLSIYIGFQGSLESYPETTVGYIALLILVPIGLSFYAVGKKHDLTAIEERLSKSSKLALSNDKGIAEYNESLNARAALWLITLLFLCGIAGIVMVLNPHLLIEYVLLFGFLMPIIIIISGGYILSVSQ
ncbi:MAG: hypothetical protein ACFFD6_03210 [Candidatus Thorarchaeota archaeon]